eukprot:7384139-Prymnesium_polylepis.1
MVGLFHIFNGRDDSPEQFTSRGVAIAYLAGLRLEFFVEIALPADSEVYDILCRRPQVSAFMKNAQLPRDVHYRAVKHLEHCLLTRRMPLSDSVCALLARRGRGTDDGRLEQAFIKQIVLKMIHTVFSPGDFAIEVRPPPLRLPAPFREAHTAQRSTRLSPMRPHRLRVMMSTGGRHR